MKLINDLLSLGIPELDEDGFRPRGRSEVMRFYGKGGGAAAPAPDPMIGQSAMANVELGKDWLAFAKDQFAEGNERQAETDALNTRVIEQQLAEQDKAGKRSDQQWADYKSTYRPIEQMNVIDALGGQNLTDSQVTDLLKSKGMGDIADDVLTTRQAERTAQSNAAAEAKADVQANYNTQNQINMRQMASMGVNPNSGRFAGITRAADTNAALAAAGAQNNARNMVRQRGVALRADQANYGRGGSSVAAQQAGIGLNSGNSAVANNQSGNQNFYANQGVMGQGFNGAIGANNSAGSMLNSLYGNQLSAWSAQQQANATSSAGLGSLVGSLAGTGAQLYL